MTITFRDDVLVEYLKECFDYDPAAGSLRWRVRADMPPHWNRRYAGLEAGTKTHGGYIAVSIKDRIYLKHRVCWAILNGRWPDKEVDHKNGSRLDCTSENIRIASRIENSWNVPNTGRNKSGFKGVSYDKRMKAWVARIKIGAKYVVLGYRDEPGEAGVLYRNAAAQHHRDFCAIERGL